MPCGKVQMSIMDAEEDGGQEKTDQEVQLLLELLPIELDLERLFSRKARRYKNQRRSFTRVYKPRLLVPCKVRHSDEKFQRRFGAPFGFRWIAYRLLHVV
eukprot:m.153889 g.153889  ORF g.153889 m.153889 type:complete len:100 (+) comp38629_c1_seq2:469-768(+)